MRDVAAELKELRLHGMAGAWADLVAQGTLAALESSRWLIDICSKSNAASAPCARSATR